VETPPTIGPDLDWQQIEHGQPIVHDHVAASALIQVLLKAEALAELWELPPIARWEAEFRFPGGMAGLVLLHHDGSVSCVGAMDLRSDHDVFAGLVQLCTYDMPTGADRRGKTVRRILTAPVVGRESGHLLVACAACGVQFEPLGSLTEHRATLLSIGACHGSA
jgi:hypothetical protein